MITREGLDRARHRGEPQHAEGEKHEKDLPLAMVRSGWLGCLSGCLGWLDRMRLPRRTANDGEGEEGEGEGLFDDLPPLVDMAWRPAHCQTHNDRGQPKC